MNFSLTTDYAIRIILYLNVHGKSTSKEMARDLHISHNYISKVLKSGKFNDLIENKPGRNGGFLLRKTGAEISLLDIMSITENNLFFNSCLENSKQCDSCKTFEESLCPLKKQYQKIDNYLREKLAMTRISELSK